MKDEDQSPRQIALCCAGTAYLARVAKQPNLLNDLSWQELEDLYANTMNAGEGLIKAAKAIQGEVVRRTLWAKSPG